MKLKQIFLQYRSAFVILMLLCQTNYYKKSYTERNNSTYLIYNILLNMRVVVIILSVLNSCNHTKYVIYICYILINIYYDFFF